MVKGTIKEKYGIHIRQLSMYQHTYQCFQTPNSYFLIVPVSQFSETELAELYYMSQYLQEQSDPYVSVFIFTKEGELTFEHEGKTYALLKAAPLFKQGVLHWSGACGISPKRPRISI